MSSGGLIPSHLNLARLASGGSLDRPLAYSTSAGRAWLSGEPVDVPDVHGAAAHLLSGAEGGRVAEERRPRACTDAGWL